MGISSASYGRLRYYPAMLSNNALCNYCPIILYTPQNKLILGRFYNKGSQIVFGGWEWAAIPSGIFGFDIDIVLSPNVQY